MGRLTGRWLGGASTLGMLAGCHVVFRLDDLDQPPVDANKVIDAPQDVVAHYRFEEAGPVIADAAGTHDGTPEGPLMLVSGHSDMAIGIPGLGSFIAVPDSADFDLMTGAIDVWVLPAPAPAGEGVAGIMSRDSNGPAGGHFALFQYKRNAFVARFQRTTDGAGGAGLFLCSTAPIEDRWMHIVVNLGDPTPEMWIDGVLQMGAQTIDPLFGAPRTCGVNEPRGLSGNDEPWVFGGLGVGATQGTTDNVSHPYTGGAIDELRILRARVTF